MAKKTKLTDGFLAAANQILSGNSIIVCTDEELVFEINQLLPAVEQIADRTWQDWKADKLPNDPRASAFRVLVKKALIREKRELFKKMEYAPKDWQKWAWILERKFKEWRLPNKHEIGGDPDNKTPITIITKVPTINTGD